MGMRRRYAIAAIVLVAAVTAAILVPPSDDGLNWIRWYGGQEIVRKTPIGQQHDMYEHVYGFDRVPETLRNRIGGFHRSQPLRNFSKFNAGLFSVSSDQKSVTAIRVVKVSWLDQKWRIVRSWMGLGR